MEPKRAGECGGDTIGGATHVGTRRRKCTVLARFDLIIVDEAHRVSPNGTAYKRIIDNFKVFILVLTLKSALKRNNELTGSAVLPSRFK